MISVLCGGVGAARFLRALALVFDPGDTEAVINTGDDTVMHGLTICPDLDTITYTLADEIDPVRGWGLAGESWNAMAALGRFDSVKPSGSGAALTWFNLGDRDLATHMYRTARLAEGASLSVTSGEIAQAFGVVQRLLPMSDQPVSTMVTLAADHAEVSFQEYFVKRQHAVAVETVRFRGAETARLTEQAAHSLRTATVVVIAPSNPLVSIAPIRSLAGVDQILADRRSSVVAISPIVGGAALKGPADRMLTELGYEPTVVGVATLYASVAEALVIDPLDAHLAPDIVRAGMRPVIVPSVMSSPAISAQLARVAVAAGGMSI